MKEEKIIDQFNKLLAKFQNYSKIRIKDKHDIQTIPFSEKGHIRYWKIEDCPIRPFRVYKTSGSTGKSCFLFFSKEAIEKMVTRLVRLLDIIGYEKEKPALNMYSYNCLDMPGPLMGEAVSKKGGCLISFGLLKKENISILKEVVSKAKPRLLISFPNQLHEIISNLPDNHTIEKCVVAGEILLKEFKNEIECKSGIKLYNMYATTEVAGIAIQKEPDDLYMVLADDGLYIEVMKPDGSTSETGKGKIVVTDLFNYSMPIIRYIIGDEVEIKRKGKEKYIRVFGRADKYINIYGEVESKKAIIECLFKILKHPNFFLVIDKDKNTYEDVIVLNIPKDEPLDEKTIKAEFERNFSFSIRIRRTRLSVPKTSSGKYRHIVDLRKLHLEDKKLGW